MYSTYPKRVKIIAADLNNLKVNTHTTTRHFFFFKSIYSMTVLGATFWGLGSQNQFLAFWDPGKPYTQRTGSPEALTVGSRAHRKQTSSHRD